MATPLDANQREIASWQNARRTGAKPKSNNFFWKVEGYIVIVNLVMFLRNLLYLNYFINLARTTSQIGAICRLRWTFV